MLLRRWAKLPTSERFWHQGYYNKHVLSKDDWIAPVWDQPVASKPSETKCVTLPNVGFKVTATIRPKFILLNAYRRK